MNLLFLLQLFYMTSSFVLIPPVTIVIIYHNYTKVNIKKTPVPLS